MDHRAMKTQSATFCESSGEARKHNTRKQEAEGRESFNRMSGHVFRGGTARSCQDIYANRASSRLSFRLYALRFSWRICIRWIDSPSLSPSSSGPIHPFFYFYLLLAIYTCAYASVCIQSRHVTHDNISQFAYETRRYRLFQSFFFFTFAPIRRRLDKCISFWVTAAGKMFPWKG